MSSIVPNATRYKMATAALNLASVTLKAMLLGTGYTPDPDHEFVSSIVAHELSGTGYVAGFGGSGRKTLASVTVTKDDATDYVLLDADDPSWTGIDAGTVRFVAIVREVTTNGDSPIVAILQLDADKTTNGGDYTHQFPAGGFLRLA